MTTTEENGQIWLTGNSMKYHLTSIQHETIQCIAYAITGEYCGLSGLSMSLYRHCLTPEQIKRLKGSKQIKSNADGSLQKSIEI